jgi:hypothetical protein
MSFFKINVSLAHDFLFYFYFINVGVRVSLRAPRLISRAMKVNNHISLQWSCGLWNSNRWSLGSKSRNWPVKLYSSVFSSCFFFIGAHYINLSGLLQWKIFKIICNFILEKKINGVILIFESINMDVAFIIYLIK